MPVGVLGRAVLVWTVVGANALALASAGALDLLRDGLASWQWYVVEAEGGEGSLASETPPRVVKSNGTGHLFFVNRADLPITPGQSYVVEARVRTEGEAMAFLMISMPGAARTPYPVSEPSQRTAERQTLRMRFTARPDEHGLRLHVVVKGQSSVSVDALSLEAVAPLDPASRLWGGGSGSPLDVWQVTGADAVLARRPGELVAVMNDRDRIGYDALAWNAENIKAVEAGWRAEEEPGFLRMHWTGEADGAPLQGHRSTVYLADGAWHSLLFDLTDEPEWRGAIHTLAFELHTNRKSAPMALGYVRALEEANLIPNADRSLRTPDGNLFGGWREAAPGEWSVSLDRVRPWTSYSRQWSERLPEVPSTMTFLDWRGDPMGIPQRFIGVCNAPPETVSARLTLREATTAVPCLTVMDPARAHVPRPWWSAPWIWSRRGVGPVGTVWFARGVYLSDVPERAALLINGDDAFEVWVNGHALGGSGNWEQSRRFGELAPFLQRYNNQILVKVENHGAWGGLIAEFYAESAGGGYAFLNTGSGWRCLETDSDAMPDWEEIQQPAVVLGRPPVQPWGTSFSYEYVGPVTPLRLHQDGGELTVSPDQPTEVRLAMEILRPASISEAVTFSLRMGGETARRLSVGMFLGSPWEPSQGTYECKLLLPAHFGTGMRGGSHELHLDDPRVAVEGDPPLAVLHLPEMPERVALAEAHVEGAGARAHIVINGEPYAPLTYYAPSAFTRDPEPKADFIRSMAMQGIHIHRVSGYFSDLWTGPGAYEFAMVDRAIDTVLANDPEAWIILNYDLRAPAWWLAANPDDAMRYHGGEPPNPGHDFQSMTSKRWREDVAAGLRAMIAHVAAQPYGGRVIGLSPNAGQTSEWINDMGYGHDALLYSDYSPAALDAYRAWVRATYGGDLDALRAAWNRPGLRFEDIQPPTPEERHHASLVNFLDPRTDRALMDYWRFRNETVAGNILHLCVVIKEATGGKWLTGTYYGYLTMFSRVYDALQESGHLGLDRVLASPDVDFLVCPSFYTWRKLGLANAPMMPVDALSASGKLLICELDERTFTESLEVQYPNGRVDTVEQTLGMLDRDFGMLATQGMGLHWMEMFDKWFREPVILDTLGRHVEAYAALPVKPLGMTPKEVCVVSDLTSPRYVKLNGGDGIHAWLVAEVLRRMNEGGFAYRHVLLDDVLAPDRLPAHKLYIMTNTLVLSGEQRERLHARFADEGASVLWLYAPGAFTPGEPASADNVSRTIGSLVRLVAERRPLSMDVTEPWGGMSVRCDTPTGPWFLPEAHGLEVIARAPTGEALMVRRQDGQRSVWFSTIPNLPPRLLRRVAEEAGVWIYARGDDPLHVGNDLIFLHAKSFGEKTLLLPDGMTLKPIIGPHMDSLSSGEPWTAYAPRTYGFVVTAPDKAMPSLPAP